MHTEQKTKPKSRSKVVLLLLLALTLCGAAGVGYWGLHRQYVPPDAIAVAERFISLIKAGNFAEAYSLTTQDALPGRTLEQFESNVAHRMGRLNEKQSVEWRGERGGYQTYGNRLRRWLAGRKLDEDRISLEFELAGVVPVEIRLVSSPDGRWRVVYFQTHAG